jgi:hypothetical protein
MTKNNDNNEGEVRLFKWRQELNLFGNKIMMENTGAKKNWGIKIYYTYKYLKSFKTQFIASKLPGILKLAIASELIVFGYQKIFIDRVKIYPEFSFINEMILNSFAYKLFAKDNNFDYFLNIGIYGCLGKSLYLQNKKLFYSLFGIGGLASIILNRLNDSVKKYFDEKIKIEDFNICNPSINIIPKLIISFFLVRFFNYFLTDQGLNLGKKLNLDKKAIFMFLWLYGIAKTTQFVSYFWGESIK